MSSRVIEVNGVSKMYRLGSIGATSLREEFHRYIARLRGTESTNPKEFWALRDVSFEVQPGEVMGIIGRNGAGKSTLLKILSRITEPTAGSAVLRGRVASLLEVGTGFHPELTGRENIYLNGAILGMTRAEVTSKFDEIVAFAEIDRFIDTPVKRYSSGMYVRLAFAVAAYLDPEILIVDEVLAVGDAKFQRKCLGKIQDATAQEGRTVLFVSHNIPVLSTICDRLCWLVDGRVRQVGPTESVLPQYLRDGQAQKGEISFAPETTIASNHDVRLIGARVIHSGIAAYTVPIDSPFDIEVSFEMKRSLRRNVAISIHLHDERGTLVMCTGPDNSEPAVAGVFTTTCHMPANLLNAIGYSLSFFVVFDATDIALHVPEALSFEVADTRRSGDYLGHIGGAVRPQLRWTQSGP